jgi:hypothetical protein
MIADIFTKKPDHIHAVMWQQGSGKVCILNVSFCAESVQPQFPEDIRAR